MARCKNKYNEEKNNIDQRCFSAWRRNARRTKTGGALEAKSLVPDSFFTLRPCQGDDGGTSPIFEVTAHHPRRPAGPIVAGECGRSRRSGSVLLEKEGGGRGGVCGLGSALPNIVDGAHLK